MSSRIGNKGLENVQIRSNPQSSAYLSRFLILCLGVFCVCERGSLSLCALCVCVFIFLALSFSVCFLLFLFVCSYFYLILLLILLMLVCILKRERERRKGYRFGIVGKWGRISEE